MKKVLMTIRQRREEKGYSQEYMAYCLGISQNGYYKMEVGLVNLKFARLIEIVRLLELDLHQLLETAMPDQFTALLKPNGAVVSTEPAQVGLVQELYERLLESRSSELLAYKSMITLRGRGRAALKA